MAQVNVSIDKLAKVPASRWRKMQRSLYKSRYLYLMLAPVLCFYILFEYLPMYGSMIAFKEFNPFQGILGSPWVGFKYFEQFFNSVYFWRLIRNTLVINVYNLLVGFTAPIILALMINEVRARIFKRTIQTIVYMPHFLSVVVVVGMIISFLSPRTGIVNLLITGLGGKPISFLNEPNWFSTIYVWSGVWQEAGWGSIIYLAALTSIDQQLYEAARVDGASRWQQLLKITLPSLVPVIIIMFILRMGRMMHIGFEKIMLLYNPVTYETGDVISTYVYRRGILGAEFSFSTAVGLFNSVVNLTLLITFNTLSKKLSKTSLW